MLVAFASATVGTAGVGLTAVDAATALPSREASRRESLEMGESQINQEVIFAPRVNSQSEDDGYLVCFVHDEAAHAVDPAVAGAVASLRHAAVAEARVAPTEDGRLDAIVDARRVL